jgi:hypothetical protein
MLGVKEAFETATRAGLYSVTSRNRASAAKLHSFPPMSELFQQWINEAQNTCNIEKLRTLWDYLDSSSTEQMVLSTTYFLSSNSFTIEYSQSN